MDNFNEETETGGMLKGVQSEVHVKLPPTRFRPPPFLGPERPSRPTLTLPHGEGNGLRRQD